MTEQLGQARQLPQFTGQGPQNHRGLHAFAAQAFEHAQGMGGFTLENGVDQPEDVKARAVRHRSLDGFQGDDVALGQQLELFDFLRGSKQVALHARSNQVHGVTLGAQACLLQPLIDPLRQLMRVHGPYLDELAVITLDQCLAPFGLLRAGIELWQADQQQRVFGRAGAVFQQCSSTLVTRLARGQAQFQQASLGEKRQARARLQQGTPIEVGIGTEHLALVEALLAGGAADRVGRFLAQQRIIAADHVDGRERALQVFGELGGGEFHGVGGRAPGGALHGLSCPALPVATAEAFRPAGDAQLPAHPLRPWHAHRPCAAVHRAGQG